MANKLRRSRDDRWIAGVCGGLAEYFGISSKVMRIICGLFKARDIGASLIVSQNYLKSLTSNPTILDVYIYYNQKYDEVLEKKITSLIDNSSYSNDLHIESQYEDMKTIQESQGNMME